MLGALTDSVTYMLDGQCTKVEGQTDYGVYSEETQRGLRLCWPQCALVQA